MLARLSVRVACRLIVLLWWAVFGLAQAGAASPPLLQEPVTTIEVAAPVWENETNADGSGLYYDLLRLVYSPLGIAVKTRSMPFVRAGLLLTMNAIDASVGSYSAETTKLGNWRFYLTPKQPIGTERLVAIFKQDRVAKWEYPGSLAGKKVAWIDGYSYEYILQVEMDYQKVDNQQQGWRLLQADRVDFLLESESDARAAACHCHIDLTDYRFELIEEKNLYIPFAKSRKGDWLRLRFDQRMDELRRSGELAQLYARYGRTMPPQE